MNQSIRIAIRNVTRQKKRSILLGGAVAFGFLVITLMNSFTSGVVKTVKDNFSHAFGGHLYFAGAEVSEHGSEISLIRDDSAARKAIAALGDSVASVHERSRASGSLYFGTKQETQRIEGVDFIDEKDFSQNLDIKSGSLSDLSKKGSLILPEETVKKLGIQLGENVLFRVSTVSGQQNVGEFVLVATTTGGLGGGSAYVDKAALNALIGLSPDAYQTINVYLKDISKSAEAEKIAYNVLKSSGPVVLKENGNDEASHMFAMRRMMGMDGLKSVAATERWEGTKFSITTIEDMMSSAMTLVVTLNNISFGVFIVLLVIIMVGILNSFRMVMLERSAEIGTMRAIGVHKDGIRNLFIAEALTITALGAAIGFIVALIIMGLVSLYTFADDVAFSFFLSKGRLFFSIAALDTLKNYLILCLMSIAAVYIPARKASQLEPAQALRASY